MHAYFMYVCEIWNNKDYIFELLHCKENVFEFSRDWSWRLPSGGTQCLVFMGQIHHHCWNWFEEGLKWRLWNIGNRKFFNSHRTCVWSLTVADSYVLTWFFSWIHFALMQSWIICQELHLLPAIPRVICWRYATILLNWIQHTVRSRYFYRRVQKHSRSSLIKPSNFRVTPYSKLKLKLSGFKCYHWFMHLCCYWIRVSSNGFPKPISIMIFDIPCYEFRRNTPVIHRA